MAMLSAAGRRQFNFYPTADRGVIPRMGYAGVFHQVSNEGAYRGETATAAAYATASVIDPQSTTRAGISTPFRPEAEDPGRKPGFTAGHGNQWAAPQSIGECADCARSPSAG